METYDDLVALARICMKQSTLASSKTVAAELRRLAQEYQRRAADLDTGILPDIGQQQPRPSGAPRPQGA